MKNKNNLKAFLDELLTEDNPPPPPDTAAALAPVEPPKDLSLDQIVDKYLVRYERESIPTVGDYESGLQGEGTIPHFSSVLEEAMNVIKEAPPADEEEDPPAEETAPAEDPGLDLGGGADAGADPAAAEDPAATGGADAAATPAAGGDADGAPAVVATPQINLNAFATSVARLINNFDVLMNPKNTILNRVEAYVTNNYDARTAKQLMDILDTNFSLRTSEDQDHREEETALANPYAQGALAGTSGG